MNLKIKKDKKYITIIKYIIIFILFLGFSVGISSSVAPTVIFNKSNLSMYGLGDLIFIIFGKTTVFTIPILIIFFLNYDFDYTRIRRTIFKGIIRAFVFLLIIYFSILLAYFFTLGKNQINFEFTDRSALALIMPAGLAILLSAVFLFLYLITYMIIAMIIEGITHKRWLSILLSIVISFIDTGTRIIFNITNFMGVLPSDNVLIFYFGDFNFGERPSYTFSIIYWIILTIVLFIVLLSINKKNWARDDLYDIKK